MLLDYGSALRQGQLLVPDLRLQAMEDEQMRMQREQHQLQRDALEEQLREREEARRTEAAFQQDFHRVMAGGGSPDAITGLMLRYPGMMDKYKPALERMEKDQLQDDITQTGAIYTRLNNGDAQGAAAILRQRVEADREAGMADPQDMALLQALESGDEREIKVAQTTIGMHLAGLTGVEQFKTIYGGDEAKTSIEREYNWRVSRFGQEAADKWLKTEDTSLVTVEPGGTVFNKSDFVTGGSSSPDNTEGGDLSAGGDVQFPFEGAQFNQEAQQYGAPRGGRTHNGLDFSGRLGTPVSPVLPGKVVAIGEDGRSGRFVRVRHSDGRVSSYAHLGDVSVAKGQNVAPGTPLGTLGRTGNVKAAEGRGVLHFVMRDKNGRAIDPAPLFGGPVRVRSKQEYDKLPPGTEYTAPDGSLRVKS